MADGIDILIDESKTIIRNDQELHMKDIFTELENFLVKYEIPVKHIFDHYWKYDVYPIMRFNDIQNLIKEEIIPKYDKLEIYTYVYKYIFMLNFGQYTIATFTNIFGMNQNTKYTFMTYKAPARLNKNLEMTYVHPKYLLEDVYRKLYMPSNQENAVALNIKKLELMDKWKTLNPGVNFTAGKQHEKSYGKNQLKLIKKIEQILVSADYDQKIPVYIGSAADIAECEKIASELFPNLEVTKNPSKSFFDPRTVNHIFKNGTHILIKVWELLDHEVIPILPYGKRKKAHISVLLKLSLTEHVTYEILGYNDIAKEKLATFLVNIQNEEESIEKKLYVKILNCKFIGRNYPIDKYVSNLRASNFVKKMYADKK